MSMYSFVLGEFDFKFRGALRKPNDFRREERKIFVLVITTALRLHLTVPKRED